MTAPLDPTSVPFSVVTSSGYVSIIVPDDSHLTFVYDTFLPPALSP